MSLTHKFDSIYFRKSMVVAAKLKFFILLVGPWAGPTQHHHLARRAKSYPHSKMLAYFIKKAKVCNLF